jgi:hypothetical protein
MTFGSARQGLQPLRRRFAPSRGCTVQRGTADGDTAHVHGNVPVDVNVDLDVFVTVDVNVFP